MTPNDPTNAWFVWWREITETGLGPYSPLHRTLDHATTLCKEPIRETNDRPKRVHVGVRIAKREPRVHALKACPACSRKVKAAERRAALGG